MSEVFYRVHWTECGEFSADNAWSCSMGLSRKPGDLSKYECECTVIDGDATPECPWCEGTGWSDCQRGYSCTVDPESLLRYFRRQAGEPQPSEQVIVFEGYRSGNDPDGEALAVPEHVVRVMTWVEFTTDCA